MLLVLKLKVTYLKSMFYLIYTLFTLQFDH